MAAEMVSEGSKTEEQHNYLSKEIQRITVELKKMIIEKEKQQEGATTTDENIQSNQDIELLDPDLAKTKGRSKKSNKRAMPMVERIKKTQKKKYTCQKCKTSGHNTSTCTTKPKQTGNEDTTQGKYPPPTPHIFPLTAIAVMQII
jgi:lipopolysaccharide biosynthesis regulator YciM